MLLLLAAVRGLEVEPEEEVVRDEDRPSVPSRSPIDALAKSVVQMLWL